MMAGLASQSLLFASPPPLLPSMAATFGANGPFITEMLFAVASLGLMITSIVSGAVVRALGVRTTIIVSATLYALAGGAPWLTSDATMLLGSRLLVGGACGLLTTGCTMLLAHSYHGAARGRVLGYQTAAGSAVGLISLLIAGASVRAFGWHPVFLIYTVFALPVAALAVFGVAPVPLPPTASSNGFGQALAVIWPVCLAACLLMMVPILTGSEVPFILSANRVTNPLVVSIVVSGVTLFSAISGTLFGRLQSGLGPRLTFAAALGLCALGYMSIALSETALLAGIGCALFGFGLGLYIPHLWTLGTSLVPESLRGHAIGLLTTSMFLGGFLYPFLFAGLQTAFGVVGAFGAIAVLMVVAALAVLVRPRSLLSGAQLAEA